MKDELRRWYPFLANESLTWERKVFAEATFFNSGIKLLEDFCRLHENSVDNFSDEIKAKPELYKSVKIKLFQLKDEIAGFEAEWSLLVSKLDIIKIKRDAYLKKCLASLENFDNDELNTKQNIEKNIEENALKILKDIEMKYQKTIFDELKYLENTILKPLLRADTILNSLSGTHVMTKINTSIIQTTITFLNYYCKKFEKM